MRNNQRWTKEELDLLKEIYFDEFNKDLAVLFNRSDVAVQLMGRKLGLKKSARVMNATRFKKGFTPYNKGLKWDDFMSKEGQKIAFKNLRLGWYDNPGILPPGSESKDKDGYLMQKLESGEWERKHRLIWEKTHGKIPDGYLVKFKDGNIHNLNVNNLYLQTRQGNMNENSIHRYPTKVIKAIRALSSLRQKINKNGK